MDHKLRISELVYNAKRRAFVVMVMSILVLQ